MKHQTDTKASAKIHLADAFFVLSLDLMLTNQTILLIACRWIYNKCIRPGLGHGFGLGTATTAEGWLDLPVQFWEGQRER